MHKYRLDSQGNRTFWMKAENLKCYQDREIQVHEWIGKVKNYVFQVQGELFKDRSMVFITEAQNFFTHSNPSKQLFPCKYID